MKIEVETLIAASPEAVFAILTDISRLPEVLAGIEQVEVLTPGPLAVGTRFRETRRMFGRLATEEMTVAEIVPSERFVLTAFNHGTRYRAEHVLDTAGTGSYVRLRFEGRPETPLAWLMAPLGWMFQSGVKAQLASDLADIKRAAEGKAQL